jgi:hypothetical protein
LRLQDRKYQGELRLQERQHQDAQFRELRNILLQKQDAQPHKSRRPWWFM